MINKYYMRPRGHGSNWIRCFVCGEPRDDNPSIYYKNGDCQRDVSSYMKTREDGLEVLALFAKYNRLVVLDDRAFAGKGVQLKVGACKNHIPEIEKLFDLIADNQSFITEEIIKEVLCVKE